MLSLSSSHVSCAPNYHQEIEGDQAAYGYAVDDTGSQDGPVVLADGGSHIYAIQVQPNQPNLQGIAYGFYDLRLA